MLHLFWWDAMLLEKLDTELDTEDLVLVAICIPNSSTITSESSGEKKLCCLGGTLVCLMPELGPGNHGWWREGTATSWTWWNAAGCSVWKEGWEGSATSIQIVTVTKTMAYLPCTLSSNMKL